MVFEEESGEIKHSGNNKKDASVEVEEDAMSFYLSEPEKAGAGNGKKGKDWIMDI